MAPPRKAPEDGKAEVHAALVPCSTPLAFVSPTVVCVAVGSSVCLWDIATDKKEYVYTSSYSISKICGNPAIGLFAFSEGGTSPQTFVHSLEPRKLLFTLPDLTELELADLAFSRCGTRFYALSRATTKRLIVFSTKTGKMLPGCDLELPARFDKIAVFPGHKDSLALVRSSSVRLVSIQKSYETYIARLLPPPVASDMDMSISAFAWTKQGNFLFATRKGALVTLDGTTGNVLHACQAEAPITSIACTPECVMTVHIGNMLRCWSHNIQETTAIDSAALTQQLPPMESQANIFTLQRSVNLDTGPGLVKGLASPQEKLLGQVAYLQVSPDGSTVVLTTSEGEVWSFSNATLEAVPLGAEGDALAMNQVISAQDLQMKLLTWFHTHPISAATFVGPLSRLCASADESGRLRLWEVVPQAGTKGFRTLTFSSALTSIACGDDGKLLVVGSDAGCLHLVNNYSWMRACISDTIRISDAGIAKVVTCGLDGAGMCVAASLFDNKVALLHVAYEEPKFVMYGFVDVMGAVEDLCFFQDAHYEEAPQVVMVGCDNDHEWPCIWTCSTPPVNYEASTAEIPRSDCPLHSAKLSTSLKLEDKPTALAALPSDQLAVGFAGGAIKVFAVPNVPGMPLAKQAAIQAVDTLPPHEQLVARLYIGMTGRVLFSASMDGTVRKTLLDGDSRQPAMQKIIHNPYNGGVAQVCASANDQLLLSTGGSDGLMVWSNPTDKVQVSASSAEEDLIDQMVQSPRISIDDKDTTEFPLWAPVSPEERERRAAEENDDPELNALSLAQRKALTLEVDGLRKKLGVLIEQNGTAPELEQLSRSDFCIDFEERDMIAAKTKERCDALRAKIEKENLARQLLRDRLIKEFWDPMKGQGCQICSLSSNLAVSNYPERIVSDEETSALRKLRIMRQVEQKEQAAQAAADCQPALKRDNFLKVEGFASGKEAYIVNWWHGGGLAQAGEKQHEDQKFLYEPFELLTNGRRRLQVHLLQSLAADYRAAFNELFKKSQGDKMGIMDQIKDKVKRTRGILAELKIDEEVPEPELFDCEDEQAVLNVRDSEIKVEKWISPAEKAAIEEARLKEEERLRIQRENDAGQRALNQMMGGTLKTKKDLSALEITLDKEPWMDQIPEEEMTEVQLAALQEFREKEKALAAEQDKYRKQLDAELKRLKTEVQDLTGQFETVLKELHHQRFAHDAKFFCQELYCVRLQLALLQSLEDSHVLKQNTSDMHEAAGKLAKAEASLEEFSQTVAGKKAKQEERVRHEREAASAQQFRAQFAASGLEPEAIGALLQLFRTKKVAAPEGAGDTQKSSQKRTAGGTAQRGSQAEMTTNFGRRLSSEMSMSLMSDADPYPDLGTGPVGDDKGGLEGDVPLGDCPETVDEASFHRMKELRRERLQAEVEVQRGAAELAEMSGLLQHLQKECDTARQEHEQLKMDLKEHEDLMKKEEYDVEILFKLKQGQVEVPQAAVVTDYSDAVVIDNEVVESRNGRITQLGKDKVGTLETIKEFRKKLSLSQWEYRMLQMQTTDLEERTKDVHMLRVTKGLQSALKGGEEGRNKADADLLERKIEHLNSTTAQKGAQLKKTFTMGSQNNKQRKQENNMLEKKLRELQQNVIQREHIRRLRAPAGGPQGGTKDGEKPRVIGGGGRIEENEASIRAAQGGFREVRARQSLMDAAKKHTEEIDVLRQELDRLRQKTFPSFVQLHEDKVNPDHR